MRVIHVVVVLITILIAGSDRISSEIIDATRTADNFDFIRSSDISKQS